MPTEVRVNSYHPIQQEQEDHLVQHVTSPLGLALAFKAISWNKILRQRLELREQPTQSSDLNLPSNRSRFWRAGKRNRH